MICIRARAVVPSLRTFWSRLAHYFWLLSELRGLLLSSYDIGFNFIFFLFSFDTTTKTTAVDFIIVNFEQYIIKRNTSADIILLIKKKISFNSLVNNIVLYRCGAHYHLHQVKNLSSLLPLLKHNAWSLIASFSLLDKENITKLAPSTDWRTKPYPLHAHIYR